MSSSMEDQSPSKRPKTESESEKVKNRAAVVGDLFYEGDSDDESVVYPVCHDDAPYHPYEKDRRCLDSHLCHRYQHRTHFEGLPFFELFKVKVKFNKNYGTTPISAQFCGEIVTVPDPCFEKYNPEPISYYSASHEYPDSVGLDVDNDYALLPISGPKPRAPICEFNTLALDFAFKMNGEDMFPRWGFRRQNPELFGDAGCAVEPVYVRGPYDRGSRKNGHYIIRTVHGLATLDRRLYGLDPRDHSMYEIDSCDPVVLDAYYSVYDGAWATIEVRMLRDDVSCVYGLIVARPCVFSKRFRLLTKQRGQDKKVTIERGEDGQVDERTRLIKLTRSVVAVPSYASLIIGAELYVGNSEIVCRDKVSFPAKQSGQEESTISYKGVEILRLTVKWESKD